MDSLRKRSDALTALAKKMRHQPTLAEKTLWNIPRNRGMDGIKFVRQFPIPPYIVDFCCREKKLVIEVDVGEHLAQMQYDRQRESDLNILGYRVIRFANDQILKDIHAV